MLARPRMAALAFAGLAATIGAACSSLAQTPDSEPIIGGPCEGCEAVFQGLPDELSSEARIAPTDEPGERLVIDGTVYDAGGAPAPGVIVYAYHTNAGGVYPPDERYPGQAAYRHGRLRAWARTDDEGHYRFLTIRPGSYPDRDVPQHVHMHVIEPGRCTYWIDSIHFDDDPKLTVEERAGQEGQGGGGVVHPERDPDGVWHVRRDIRLGLGVPDYPGS